MEILLLSLIVAIRLIVPLTVLRFPFWGGLACIAADTSDTIIPDAFGVEVIPRYHAFDKPFDMYGLSMMAWVSLSWFDGRARATALVLYAIRLVAVIAYGFTGVRQVFMYGPNVFENFYLFTAAALTANPRFRYRDWWHLAAILALVALPKLLQEYVMHYTEHQTWRFVRTYILLQD